jgi:hypothetical protein
MIHVFKCGPRWAAGWLIKITGTRRLILFSCISLFICSPLNAQFCASLMPSSNDKRPYEVGIAGNILRGGGLVIITKSPKNGHSAGGGSTWRYHTAPDCYTDKFQK